MYVPAHFAEPRIEVMQQLMRAQPLATVATLSREGLSGNHIPLSGNGGVRPIRHPARTCGARELPVAGLR